MCIVVFCIVSIYYSIFGVRTVWQCGKELLLNPFKCITEREEVIVNNPYKNVVAHIRTGNELNKDEREFLLLRKPKIKQSLEKITNMSLENKRIPTISVICSGGGYRALLGTLGGLMGLEKIGVLDCVTYISTLSGSTWALGLWMSTGMNLQQLKKYIIKRLTLNFYHLTRIERRQIARMLLIKIAFKQPFSLVDLFGSLLAKHLLEGYFGDKTQMVHLSDQAQLIHKAHVPFPIYTAVDGRMRVARNPAWYEFTPFEIGSSEYGLYIPTWAFGRKFYNGQSLDYAPEQSLGFFFGIFGSAFGAHLGLAWERVIKYLTPSPLRSIIEKTIIKSRISNIRIFWATVFNFMKGMNTNDTSLSKQNYIKLIDAGIEYNLPYPPVSGERIERKSDILIFFDFSRRHIPYHLKKAEEYARRKGLKFPPIDYTDIDKKAISIFSDSNDNEVPVVIYMPRVSDHQLWQSKKEASAYKKYKNIEHFNFKDCAFSGFCHTLNFQYKQEQSKQVMNQMEFNVLANEEVIKEAILEVIERISQKKDTRKN